MLSVLLFLFMAMDVDSLAELAINQNPYLIEKAAQTMGAMGEEYPFLFLLPLPYTTLEWEESRGFSAAINFPLLEPSFVFLIPALMLDRKIAAEARIYAEAQVKKEFASVFADYIYYNSLKDIVDSLFGVVSRLRELKEEEFKLGRIDYKEWYEIELKYLQERERYNRVKLEFEAVSSKVKIILKTDSIPTIFSPFKPFSLDYDSVMFSAYHELIAFLRRKVDYYRYYTLFSFLPSLNYYYSNVSQGGKGQFMARTSFNLSQIVSNLRYLNRQKRYYELLEKERLYRDSITRAKKLATEELYEKYSNQIRESLILRRNFLQKVEEDYNKGLASYTLYLQAKADFYIGMIEFLDSSYRIIKESLQ